MQATDTRKTNGWAPVASFGNCFRLWHFSDVPRLPEDVRCWGQRGRVKVRFLNQLLTHIGPHSRSPPAISSHFDLNREDRVSSSCKRLADAAPTPRSGHNRKRSAMGARSSRWRTVASLVLFASPRRSQTTCCHPCSKEPDQRLRQPTPIPKFCALNPR